MRRQMITWPLAGGGVALAAGYPLLLAIPGVGLAYFLLGLGLALLGTLAGAVLAAVRLGLLRGHDGSGRRPR